MEWTKVPTNLITSDLSDAEILAIVKYQLVFSLTEIEPTDKILNKFLTKKQKNIAKNFVADIKTRVENDVETIKKRRTKNRVYYNNNKVSSDLSEKNSDYLKVTSKPSQIREDKIRVDKIREDNKEKEINKEKEKFTLFFKSFPKQVDEYKTFTLFDTLINQKIVSFEELMNGVERYKKYCSRNITDEKYIKNPYNWLNDMGWLNKDEKKDEKAYSYNAFT